MCASCNLKVVPLANAANYAYTIPIQDFSAKPNRCKFKVMLCTSKDKVNAALSPLNIKIDSMEQMERLADYYDSGQATAFYKVDISELLGKIDFTPAEQSKTECDLVCTY